MKDKSRVEDYILLRINLNSFQWYNGDFEGKKNRLTKIQLRFI